MFSQLPNPKQKDIDDAVVRAHKLRSEYFAQCFRKLFRRNKK